MKSFFIAAMLLLVCGVASASDSTYIEGTVFSAIGQPIENADVILTLKDSFIPLASTKTDKTGRYRLLSREFGFLNLVIAAPYHVHVRKGVILVGDHTIASECILATNITSNTQIDSIGVIGDFNRWSFGSYQLMKRDKKGRYAIEIPSVEGRNAYQLLFFTNTMQKDGLRSVNGIGTELQFDDGGDYRTVVNSEKGKTLKIEFDPAKHPSSSKRGEVAFAMQEDQMLESELSYNLEVKRQVARLSDVDTRDSAAAEAAFDSLRTLGGRLNAELSRYPGGRLAEVAAARFLSVYNSPILIDLPDPVMADMVTRNAGPNSLIWSFDTEPIEVVLHGTKKMDEHWNFVDFLLSKCTTRRIVPELYYRIVQYVSEIGDSARLDKYYYGSLREFADDPIVKELQIVFDPSAKIRIGAPLPPFSFENINEPTSVITPESFKGKYVLIDLWATWCGPCVREMPNLHAAYDKFKSDKFELLSISLDKDVDKIAAFRKDKFPMPWLHTYTPGVFQSPAAVLFETQGIPKPILVSPDGRIIAITNGLRGNDLSRTLGKYLKE